MDTVTQNEVALEVIASEEAYYGKIKTAEIAEATPSLALLTYCDLQIHALVALRESLTTDDGVIIDAILKREFFPTRHGVVSALI